MRDGKWLKMGDNSNMPHPKCIGSKKNPVWNQKGAKVGSEYLPTSKTPQCVRSVCTVFPKLQSSRFRKRDSAKE